MSEPVFPQYKDLGKRSDQEIRDGFDHNVDPAHGNHVRAQFFLDELRHREGKKRERLMIGLTIAIFVLTIVNVVFVGWTVFGGDESSSGHPGTVASTDAINIPDGRRSVPPLLPGPMDGRADPPDDRDRPVPEQCHLAGRDRDHHTAALCLR